MDNFSDLLLEDQSRSMFRIRLLSKIVHLVGLSCKLSTVLAFYLIDFIKSKFETLIGFHLSNI